MEHGIIFRSETVISDHLQEITLLNELKERVIADTVTGKIDVRDTIIPEHVCDDEYNIIYEDSKCEEENEDQNF